MVQDGRRPLILYVGPNLPTTAASCHGQTHKIRLKQSPILNLEKLASFVFGYNYFKANMYKTYIFGHHCFPTDLQKKEALIFQEVCRVVKVIKKTDQFSVQGSFNLNGC